jgi:hypothetical protein
MPSGPTSVCRPSNNKRQIANSTGEIRSLLPSEIASVFGIIGVVAFFATLVSVGACLEISGVVIAQAHTHYPEHGIYLSLDGVYDDLYKSNHLAAPSESLADSMRVVRR